MPGRSRHVNTIVEGSTASPSSNASPSLSPLDLPSKIVSFFLEVEVSPLQLSLSTTLGDLYVIDCGLDDVALTHELLGQQVLNDGVFDGLSDGPCRYCLLLWLLSLLKDLQGPHLSVFSVGDLSVVALECKKLVKMDLICLRTLVDDFTQTDDIANPIQTTEHEVGIGRTISTDRGSRCGCGILQYNTHCG